MTRNKISINAVLVIAGAFLAMTLSDASSANKWYTARTVNGRTQPLSAGTETITMPDGRTVGINSATVSGGLIDLVISLYNNPQGDDNGNTQDVDPANINQDAYEKIVQYFADGVYEATEGAHTIRNVRIYRGGLRQDADVTWGPEGHPGAWYMNQQGIEATIGMYDKFGANVFTNSAEHEGGGYTLAHEFGHYFYGILDEYCVYDATIDDWSTLLPGERAIPCIMNNQWNARGRDYRWLNHSIMVDTTDAIPIAYECRVGAAQYQAYTEGAWPVLSRNPTTDPQDTARQIWYRTNRGMRMYYPELAAVAPTGMNPPRIDLSSATALKDLASRTKLNILWMGSNIVVEIIIDKSGSMSGSPLANAKSAAKLLVDQIPDNSAVGVISFDDVISTVYGITVVTGTTMRASIKSAIDGISSGNLTDIGDACMSGLSQIQAFGHTNFTRVAFLLSDGEQTVDTPPAVSPLEAAASFQAAQIPIMAFGYGYASSTLLAMAGMTGGTYYDSPTSLASISAAFQDAFASVSARQNLADGTYMASATSAKGTSTVSIPFQVDSTIADINVTVGYDSTNAVALNLTDPNGATRQAASTNTSGTECLLLFTASSPVVGQWKVAGTVASGTSLRYQVNAGVNGFTYYLTPVSLGSNTVAYPNKVDIVARLTRGPSINGAVVTAIITDEQTNSTSITLANSADGTYSGTFTPTNNGIFDVVVSADNSASNATYTYADMLISADENGEIGTVTPDAPVSNAFTRTASFQVTVDASIPYAPSSVTASDGMYPSSGGYPDYVKVSWNAVADAATYEIWRSADSYSGDAVKIGEVQSPTTTYTDTAVAVQNVYYYWVKSSNFQGTSSLSYESNMGSPLFGPAVWINDATSATVTYGSPVVVKALLRTGSAAGTWCDWWVVAYAETLGAIFYLDSNVQWQQAYGGFADVRPIYQGPLFDLPTPYTVFSWHGLPAGTWKFYFGLDTIVNGRLDPDVTYYGMGVLNVQ